MFHKRRLEPLLPRNVVAQMTEEMLGVIMRKQFSRRGQECSIIRVQIIEGDGLYQNGDRVWRYYPAKKCVTDYDFFELVLHENTATARLCSFLPGNAKYCYEEYTSTNDVTPFGFLYSCLFADSGQASQHSGVRRDNIVETQ